jgi:hypothetical protein
MKCIRCGQDTPRLTLAQRYCPPCGHEVALLEAPRSAPAFTPAWRRRDLSRDETGVLR